MKSKAIVEYIQSKNKIIHEQTGIWLVAQDELQTEYTDKEVESIIADLDLSSDAQACPYCILYIHDNCKECPIKTGCSNDDSAYSKVLNKLGDCITESVLESEINSMATKLHSNLEKIKKIEEEEDE
jgi:hypothetical protein